MPSMEKQEFFVQTQYGEAFTDTGFYDWFTDKAQKAGVPKGRPPHGVNRMQDWLGPVDI